MPACLRDAAPDSWGRRVILNRKLGLKGPNADVDKLDELTYALESGSDRIGALDFQVSPFDYAPRQAAAATLEELLNAADRVEKGVPITPDLEQALFHGTAIGGARPKALVDGGESRLIAKFSSNTDTYSVVKGEYVSMRLASLAGLDAAPVEMVSAAGRDVLLVHRFDRVRDGDLWTRRATVSAMTLLGLNEVTGRYASYEDLAAVVRHRFVDPKGTLRELYSRLTFNVLTGNTDDHARNHAAFWDGRTLRLTPAYDVCPQPRAGEEAGQSMLIKGGDNKSRLSTCIEAAGGFLLETTEAVAIIADQVTTIRRRWPEVCEEAGLTDIDQRYFWRRQFLNPYAFYGAPSAITDLIADA